MVRTRLLLILVALAFAVEASRAGPPACAPFEDENGPLLIGDPKLDGGTELGWTASVEADIVTPVLHTRMAAPVLLGAIRRTPPEPGAGTSDVALPAADLGWSVMPRVELGYRFGQAAGELLMGYRFLSIGGTDSGLSTELDMHVIDLDYANHEYSLGPLWDMKWRAGVRLANLFTDTRLDSAVVSQRTTNFFLGAGPHVALDLRRRLPWEGLALFGRIDTTSPIGQLALMFEETRLGVVPGYGQTRLVTPGPIITLGVQAGLNWQPRHSLGLTAGYALENWWDLGNSFGERRGQSVTLQGFFVRGEWRY